MNQNVATWPDMSQNNGLYNALPDATSDSTFIDPSMFASPGVDIGPIPSTPQQFQQRLQQNGAVRNPYQVSSMVPSKRPREDSTGTPLSRSHTPAQAQFGFPGGQQQVPGGGAPPMQVPPPFPHLHQAAGSANATPSPTLQNQHFRPPAAPPQRVQTVSPAQNPAAPQMSPMGFMQGSPMSQPYGQNFPGQFQPVQLTNNLQNRQQEANRQYQMRLQAQLTANNMAAAQHQRPQPGPMMGPGMPHQPGMPRNMNPGQFPSQPVQRGAATDSFVKNVAALMQQHSLPFNPQPVVAGRPIDLYRLYFTVMKAKGSKIVTAHNGWSTIAQHMGNFAPQQLSMVGEEIKQIYEQNLGPYENAYWAKHRQQQQIQAAQQQHMKAMNPQQAVQMGAMGAAQSFGPQMSPTKPAPPSAQQQMTAQQQYLHTLQRSQAMHQQQMEQSTPNKANAQLPGVNGWSTPQPDAKMPVNALQHRKSVSRQLESTPPQGRGPGFPSPSPGPVDKLRESIPPAGPPTTNGITKPPDLTLAHSTEYHISSRKLTKTHGGYEVDPLSQMGEEIAKNKPNVPNFEEMGTIDVRALTMSLQSGIHGEVRLALDVLVKLSHEQKPFELEKCEDLIDVLVECADEQLNALAEDNPEVSDIVDLTPYEDVVRNCRAEVQAVQTIPEFGTHEFELDRKADRLIAITTIMRNLSFFELNHSLLASPTVLKFISNAIRLIGTRILLLRSHLNTADFMKDLVTFLSNTSDKIVLPSREEAYNILQFLCAFAPCPRPGTPVRFTPYNPMIHRYLPPAIDSLAKLLARDDPNRTFYRQLFAAEAADEPPYDLLTRAFALAISVVPDRTSRRTGDDKRIAEARKPYLMQGMLAGDILASLAPGPDSGVCRSWLEADDGWAASLLRFSVFLCGNDTRPPAPSQGNRAQRLEQDTQGFQLIIHRALSMLKRLGEKSKGGDSLVKSGHLSSHGQANGHNTVNARMDDSDSDDSEAEDMVPLNAGGSKWLVKADVLPKKEVLLGALLTPNIDQVALRQLCSFGSLDDF